MALPIDPSYAPMGARLVAEIPKAGRWQYEPKWDGFRCLAFRDGPSIRLVSKNGQPLERYFPEIVEALRGVGAPRFVIDGELAISTEEGFSFDGLLQRIHPAASRITRLARETPATLIVFDLLVDGKGASLVSEALRKRRLALEAFARRFISQEQRIVLSPATGDVKQARRWFSGVGATLDGIVAKLADAPYLSGTRDGMVKVKKMRTADCVVGGFRPSSGGKGSKGIGSLLLGLHEDGLLHHVGFCSSFSTAQRRELMERLKPLMGGKGFTGRAPGGPSRWNGGRESQWEPLAPKLVVEVRYDHFTSGRFRHGTKFERWRPDKAPRQCTMDQVRQESAVHMMNLFRPVRKAAG